MAKAPQKTIKIKLLGIVSETNKADILKFSVCMAMHCKSLKYDDKTGTVWCDYLECVM